MLILVNNKIKAMPLEKKIDSSPMNNVTRISGDTKIIGNITTQHDIRIDGYLEGKIKTDGKLVIGETGICVGEAECESVDISGAFDGVLKVSELTSLREKCVFTGELHSDQLSVEPSVRISGQLISPELSKSKDKKSVPPTVSAPREPAPAVSPETK